MIPSARPTVPPVAITIFTWKLFCFARFWKVRTNGRMDNVITTCRESGSAKWIKNEAVNQRYERMIKKYIFISLFRTARPWIMKIWNFPDLRFPVDANTIFLVLHTVVQLKHDFQHTYLDKFLLKNINNT